VFLQGGASGARSLAVASGGGIQLGGDVALDPTGRLELAGTDIALAGGADRLEAGSIALTKNGDAEGALLAQTGDLELRASNGSLTTSSGAEIVASEKLTLAAASSLRLGGSVSAERVELRSGQIAMSGGASVVANSITATSGPSSGSYATPTGNEVSSELVSDRVVRRAIYADGRALTDADLARFAQSGIDSPEGPALGDSADDAAIWQTAPSATPPPLEGSAAALAGRPLWLDEVKAFLRRDPRGDVGQLSAGDRQAAPLHERLRSADAERAAQLYWELFRPSYASDPDAAIERQAELRALFARAAEQGTDEESLVRRIASDPEARAAAQRAGEMLDGLRTLGLVEADYAALRTDLLGPLAPEGMDPAAFAELIDREF
jgi:hypothetical protein